MVHNIRMSGDNIKDRKQKAFLALRWTRLFFQTDEKINNENN